jgi:hypothetical protein
VKIKIDEKKTKNYSLFEVTGAEHQRCFRMPGRQRMTMADGHLEINKQKQKNICKKHLWVPNLLVIVGFATGTRSWLGTGMKN